MGDEKTRVYGENININKNKVKLFWNKRGENYTEDNPYKAVKCNDNNTEYAKMLDEYEKNNIIPKLNINKNSKVLDIGCGIGRLAEILVPKSNYYLGTDFAESLLNIAKSRIVSFGNYDFQVSDFINVSDNIIVKKNAPFNKVILAGVAMYINDEELTSCFENLLKILDTKSIIYLSGPIATKERLTLEEFYSKDLKSEYSVIYRTIDEYMDVFKTLTDNGFKIIENKNFLSEIKQYSETERHYFILIRE